MPTVITPDDLAPFATIDPAKAAAMIEDAMADASRVAPCINDDDLTTEKVAQFKSVIRAALLRWNDAGSGAFQTQAAGPFSVGVDTRQQRRGMFWPSEIEALQDICRDEAATTGGAFSIRPAGGTGNHMPWCAQMLGANYCSCGADLTNYQYPLYEGGVLSSEGDDY